ncbi:MAG: carbohydrate kinase family protein [Anaerolineales bacterium]
MPRILVSGLINIETTLKVDSFPIPYFPVRYPFHGINSTVSGVGYNIAKALTTLGNEVAFLSIIGEDIAAQQARSALSAENIPAENVLGLMPHTAQSVIIYNPEGQRQIHTDLKDIQQSVYPVEIFDQEMETCDLLALCNINYSRPLLERGLLAGKPIATDVHTIGEIADEYNQDFMRTANILFMSDENLPTCPEDWARQVKNAYDPEILVIGLGADGVLLSIRDDNFMERIPAVPTRPVVNTIGAGDALFSSFIHSYLHSGNPYEAIQKAIVFASYKIGEKGAAEGFLDQDGLENLYLETYH